MAAQSFDSFHAYSSFREDSRAFLLERRPYFQVIQYSLYGTPYALPVFKACQMYAGSFWCVMYIQWLRRELEHLISYSFPFFLPFNPSISFATRISQMPTSISSKLLYEQSWKTDSHDGRSRWESGKKGAYWVKASLWNQTNGQKEKRETYVRHVGGKVRWSLPLRRWQRDTCNGRPRCVLLAAKPDSTR